VFQGQQADFLPRQVIRRAEALSTTSASLKRKREIDEDVDLYGETETTEKKSRGNNKEELTSTGKNIEFAQQAAAATMKEKVEWLMFLVSQEGELQVFHGVTTLMIDSPIK
jgi:hypothetical protein